MLKSIKSNFPCVKSVRIGSYSGPHFPAFGLNTERYSVFSPTAGKSERKFELIDLCITFDVVNTAYGFFCKHICK